MPTEKGEADINLKGEKDIGYVNWTQEMSIHSDDDITAAAIVDLISGNQFKDLLKEFYLNIMKELTVMISVKRLESAMWRM